MLQNQQNTSQIISQILEIDEIKRQKNRKKQSSCLSSDRLGKNINNNNNSKMKNNITKLIEKKKNYSQNIRERNLNITNKKKKQYNILILNQNNIQNKQQINNIQLKQSYINLQILDKQKQQIITLKKRNSKSTSNLLSKKKSITNFNSLHFQPVIINGGTCDQKIDHKFAQFGSSKSKDKDKSIRFNKMKIYPKEVNQVIYGRCFYKDEKIQIKRDQYTKENKPILHRSHYHFKKQSLTKSTDIQILDHISEVGLLQGTSVNIMDIPLTLSPTSSSQHQADNSNEIIQKLREEIAELKKVNSGLELRAYMAEKKVVEEIAVYKKKMAKQLGEWREKCTKLRAENMKIKSFRDTSISMNISKDQQ